ncbi:MAG TPA: cobalamin-dependent protein [Longimicrobiaceae bacterium]|nr:cobalamin-dependent protein [Longimicrobiaceae bacterium]
MTATASAYLDALLTGRRGEAMKVVDAAREAGMDLRALYLEVFQPALREVGRLWQENRITVADEHLATAITQAAMTRLYTELFTAPAVPPRLLIAACTDAERHEVGLRMVCDLLEMEGWDTLFLGANVPTEDLVSMIVERNPDVVALSAAIAPHLPQVRETIRAIRDATGANAPLVAVGGRPFVADPGLAERLGADLTALDAAEAVAMLQRRFAA